MKRLLEVTRTKGSKGMTIRELSDFIGECGRAGLSPDHVLRARTTFAGRIHSLTARSEDS